MNIKFNDLARQWDDIKTHATPRVRDVLESGWYIGGPEVENFEKNFANYFGTKYAVGVSNGTDALKLALATFCLDGEVEVIIPANTYIADALAPVYQLTKHTITLIDCDQHYQMDVNKLEEYLKNSIEYYTDNNRIIIPVHLYGHPVDMKEIMRLAREYKCFVLEDASQAHGTKCYGQSVGTFGDMTAWSCYPGKNLGAAGDAGVITTDNETYYEKLKSLRNYGSSKKYHYDSIGWNNRLDPIQAVILDEKLKYLDKWTKIKNDLVDLYNENLKNVSQVVTPPVARYTDVHSYHLYVIRAENRDELQKYLNDNGVQTLIHYPIPIQKTTPFKYLDNDKSPNTVKWADEILSLPLHQYMDNKDVEYVTDLINKFYN